MDKCDSYSSITCRYEEHLSQFGRKVLNALVRNLETDQFNSSNKSTFHDRPVSQYNSNRRVLTLRDESKASNIPPLITKDNIREDRITASDRFDEHTLDTRGPTGAPSAQSGGTRCPRATARSGATARDFISCDAAHTSVADNTDDKPSHVHWNNMFDAELMADEVVTNPGFVLRQLENEGRQTPETRFPNEQKRGRTERAKTNDDRKPKKKADSEDTTSRKAKRACDDTKRSLRKQTYKKAVKNWLEDVAADDSDDGGAEHDRVGPNSPPTNTQ